MPLSAGTRLGTYQILSPLGAGAMGEVYRARDTRLGRQVAVKVLPEAVASSPERLARFEREARIVAGLSHPNIVVLHSIEEEDGIGFLTMELVEGQTLAALVTPGGLPLAGILELSIPLADALHAAHEHGVIHRDLKPGNVMVTRDGRVKILDFGLAKLSHVEATVEGTTLAPAGETSLSEEGRVVGTVPYMAPEQIGGDEVDARADLFALGIILYELAAGRRPFTGKTPSLTSLAILRDTPESLTSLRDDLPAELDRIVSRCLEKNPRDRVRTAMEVRDALRGLAQPGEHGAVIKQATPAVGSIAVLPFVNMSGDEESEYLSDGLAVELLNVLAKIRGLRVAARSSAFTFKGRGATVQEVGRALNVASVLEGSVRKAGNRVRISVQLVKVSNGFPLWSETYDRTLEDIFTMQDDIAHSVMKELRAMLLEEEAGSKASSEMRAEVAKAARGRGQNAEAHRLYLQGRYFAERLTREDVARGIEYLLKALELDPGNALAWAALSRAYSNEADAGWLPVDEGFRRAREAAERAITLEPDLAEGHSEMGSIRRAYDWDWKGADASYRRALELAPGSASVFRQAGLLAWHLGRIEESVGLFRRAVEQDPLSASACNNLGLALHSAGRLSDAETAFHKSLELSPTRVGTHMMLSLLLADQCRGAEAVAEAMREPEEWARLWALAIAHRAAGNLAEADAMLRALMERHPKDAAFQIAEAHAARGDPDRAFEWLERAYAHRDSGLTDLKTSPRLRPLHDDPRWGAFSRKMGFEE